MGSIPAPGRRLPRPRPGPAAQAVPLPAWVRLLVLIALGKVLFCLALLPWTPLSGGGVDLLLVTVFAATGLCLLVMGRADRRAVSLGAFYLLVSTSFTFPLLAQVGRGAFGVAPLARFVGNVYIEAYQPFFFWLFVRDFPRTRRVQPRGRLFRAMVAATVVVGSVLLLANLVLAFDAAGPLTGPLSRLAGRNTPGALYWPLLYGMVVPAVFYSLRQARRAPPDERRRVWTVVAGLALGVAPIVIIGVAASFIPPLMRYIYTPEGERTLGAVLIYPSILSLPVITAYAVLAQRALVLSQVLRRAVRYALARYTLAAVAALPLVVLLAEIYAGRNRSVAELLSGSTGLLLAGCAAAGAVLFWLRPRVLSALDRRFFREQYDARGILAELVDRTRALRSPAELAGVLEGEIGRALHPVFQETLVLDPPSALLESVGGALPPLGVASALARKLAAEAAPLEVDWRRGSGWAAQLPHSEQEWLSGADVRLVVPLTGADGGLIGALALGEKRSELPYDAADRLLLSAAAASAALAVEHRLLGAPRAAGSTETAATQTDAPARECPGCGSVAPCGAEACERCGGAMGAAALPLVLGGKFRALERLGAGGMGVVYRGVDLALGRDVAIKTLPKMGPREARWLRKEARSMAAVSHPNLALIFGAESWHGVPMLVVEYLPGGTLADRLAKGAVPVDEALGIAAALAPALGCIHEAGILHRDIKPSNIGFAADGRPKLLDFGLARAVEAAHQAEAVPASWHSSDAAEGWQWSRAESGLTEAGDWAGTLQYLPPEAANGESPAGSWDLWALCMVLYEAVAGKHPLAGGTPHWTMVRIAEADIPDIRELAPGVPEPVAAFLRAGLHAERRKRPGSAAELGKRLQALRGGLVSVGP